MKIDNEFTVGVPIERAWKVLTDLEGIAPCLPGAQLTGVDGDVYSGKVKFKVGPVISEYAGTARFVKKDASAYRAAIDAKGKDSRLRPPCLPVPGNLPRRAHRLTPSPRRVSHPIRQRVRRLRRPAA